MEAPHIDDEERRRRLTWRHRLSPSRRTNDVAAIAASLIGLHSSDPATVYLSAMARMADPGPDAVDDALYEDRSVIRHHAMRRTLWVLHRDLAAAAHASTTVSFLDTETRRFVGMLEANDIPDAGEWLARARARLYDEVASSQPVTTRDIGTAVPELAIPLEAQGVTLSAHSRILLLMGYAGELVRTTPVGTWISSQYRWAIMDWWAPGALGAVEEDAAIERILDAYLTRFGPATETDIVWWFGWTRTRTRHALAQLGAIEVGLDDGTAWISPSDEPAGDAEPWVAFLPGLDSTTMGWKERDWYLDPDHTDQLFDRNGNAGPTVWVDGRIVGGWAQRPDGTIAYDLLDPSAEDRAAEISDAADRLARAYGDIRHKVRFPVPLGKRLV